MIAKASTRAKVKYRDKTYDQVNITVYKGQRDILKAHAESRGESLNAFVNRAIAEALERDTAKQ